MKYEGRELSCGKMLTQPGHKVPWAGSGGINGDWGQKWGQRQGYQEANNLGGCLGAGGLFEMAPGF